MSGTAQIIASLYTTWGDSGAAGRDTPATVRNLIATLQSLTGSVATPEQYGAIGNGIADDTTAFNSALAAAKVVLVGPNKYVVNAVTVNNGNVILGMFAPIIYDDSGSAVTNSAERPMIIAKTAAVDCFNVSACHHYAIMNLIINGVGNGANGISDNSQAVGAYPLYENLTIINCVQGIGGARAAGVVGQARILHCEMGSCTNGLLNPNDCQVTACDFSANTTNGVYIGSGNGASSFTNCRGEWNAGPAFNCDGANDVSFDGCWTDSNNGPAFYIHGSATGISVNGGSHRNNGQTNGSGTRSHVYLNTATHVVITGMACRSVTNSRPTYFIEYAGTNSSVAVCGNDATGGATGSNPTTYRAAGNVGLTDA